MKRLRWMLLLTALVAQIAHALTMIEFMEMKAGRQTEIVKPIMLSFLRVGYKRVPSNEITLIIEMEKLAYEKGYRYESVEQVAKEAAIRLGMTQ